MSILVAAPKVAACGIWLIMFELWFPLLVDLIPVKGNGNDSTLGEKKMKSSKKKTNPRWQAVVLYDIDFCQRACCTQTFSPWWCTTASPWTWRSQVKYLCLLILCCVSITLCWFFDWLIDQLSRSLLKREEWVAVMDTTTTLKPPLAPPLSSPSPICAF